MDVAVVGAGLVGLAIADELARRGAEVVVYDRGEPAKAASWAGAGMLAPYSESLHGETPAALSRVGIASLSAYPAFVADLRERTGIDAHLRSGGTLHAAFDEAELDALARSAATMQVAAERLSRDGAIEREPMLSNRICGGLLVAGEGQVDNRRLGRALVAAARQRGVRVESDCGAIALEADDRRIRGIRTPQGYRSATAVVNAAGAWASELAGVPPRARVPVRPVKGQILALAVPQGLIRGLVWGPGVYLVPRPDGRLLVGATVEEAGYDVRVTAGGVHALLAAALGLAPSLDGFTVSETWAGVRPASADGLPFIGATAVAGYFVASGHFRNGILLAPATASLIGAAIAGERASSDALALSPLGRTERVAGSANETV